MKAIYLHQNATIREARRALAEHALIFEADTETWDALRGIARGLGFTFVPTAPLDRSIVPTEPSP